MKSVCFATSDAVQLCYVEHLLDDIRHATLVFIPGWSMPASIWERQLEHFSGRHSLLAFDPRGQGRSAAPDYGYTLERRTRDLQELLDRFPGRTFILVGWSLAVLESIAYIDHYGQDRIRGLVLVDNSVGEGPEPPPRKGENPFFVELRTQREETLRRFIDAIFRTDPGDAQRTTLLTSALKTDVEDSLRLLSYDKPRSYWRDILYRVRTPILYLVTPRWQAQAERVAKRHGDAQVDIFSTAGHALFWDEADRFNAVLENFLARINGAGGR
jgi:microsomal epoxide hydrolase